MKSRRTVGTAACKPRACKPSSRRADLLQLGHAPKKRLAETPLPDLRIWAEGLAVALRRERNKSMSGHWSYDLNRHIALKRARDRVKTEIATRARSTAQKKKKPRQSRGL